MIKLVHTSGPSVTMSSNRFCATKDRNRVMDGHPNMSEETQCPQAVLIAGDCRTELAKVETESVDLIFTSPPYANQRASTYGGIKPEAYCEWFIPIANELYRVLKPTGTFVLNVKEPAIDGERHTHVIEIILEMRKRGWFWTEELVWHKKNCYPGKWPNRFRDAWERLLQFNKGKRFKMNQEAVMVPVGDWYDSRMKNLSETDKVRDESRVGSGFGKKIDNWLGREMVYPTNVLHGATECGNRNHSAAFPYWLPEWFINLFTDPGDTVLDPFNGSGTTTIAALENGRNAIGIELYWPYHLTLKGSLQRRFEVHDMSQITDQQITDYVEQNIESFHQKRLASLGGLTLRDLIANKNPYLFRSKNLVKVSDLIRSLLDAHLSSQEETMFGEFLEGLAIHVAETVHGGRKSTTEGIDLEFEKQKGDTTERFLVSIKSGPHWGNSSQIKKMTTDFNRAKRTFAQGNQTAEIKTVNGCCYGRDENPFKEGQYYKYCGQEFWELISDDPGLYTRIIEPLGHEAKKRNDRFNKDYAAVVNRLCQEFTNEFCSDSGHIDWEKLVRFGSATTPAIALPAQVRTVNRLKNIANVVDVLKQWQHADIAEVLLQQAANIGTQDDTVKTLMGSLRGFLMCIGTLRFNGTINITVTNEGQVRSEFTLQSGHVVKIAFKDIRSVSASVTAPDGSAVKLPKNGELTRKTANKKLLEHQLFAELTTP